MKRIFYVMIALILAASTLAITVSAASPAIDTAVLELGQLKVCKVAGAGVPEGKPFTIQVENNRYSVPAGPGDGFCVLAGQYPVGTQVTIQEQIPAGYYVSQIESKPDRVVTQDVAQGSVIIQVGSGVTEIIFTNNAIGLPTLTPKPTKTATPTPECAPNCDPTPTPIPRGRLQICKEADGAGVTGYFTFSFSGRDVTVPVGACSGLIGVDAGTLTITEEAQAGYSVTDIYTIPADRLKRENHNTRTATVTITEGLAASQTIVVFRNKATTTTTATPTNTATGTPTACVPTTETVTPDFSPLSEWAVVEGLGTVHPWLDIQAKGTARHVLEGNDPNLAVYASEDPVRGTVYNAGMVASEGFSDPETQALPPFGGPHQYTFTFAPGVTISNFSLHMLDFGDYNPTGSTSHLVTMTAFNASNAVVTSQQLSYTSDGATSGGQSPVYGDLSAAGDAILATSGQPGNWTWDVTGVGIVRVVLDFGVGYDPNIGFHLLSFTGTVPCSGVGITPSPTATNTATATPSPTPSATPTNTPSACVPTTIDPDFSQLGEGDPVEGLGTVHPWLDIQAKGTAVHVLEGANANPAVYASGTVYNAGMVAAGGFSDAETQLAGDPHQYTFTFAPGVTVSNFTLRMLDFGDYNPTGSTSHLVTMTAFNASNAVVTSQQLSYTSDGATSGGQSPVYGDLSKSGDAFSATPGQPGNWTWDVTGADIVRVVLDFGVGHDPNIGLDILGFTVECAIPAPAVATLVSPSGSITDTTPTYTWDKVNAATWYYLWINHVDADGAHTTVHKKWYESSATCSGSTCSFSPPVDLPAGNYRWWIRTWNEAGFGPWSSPLDFSIP